MDELRKEILDNLPAGTIMRRTGWAQTKCPNCDSNSKKMHLHIQLKKGSPIIYKCFRASCNTSGALNRRMGRKLGFKIALNNKIEEEAVKYSKYSTNHNYYAKSKNYNLGTLDIFAIEYFKERTGKDLEDYQELFRVSSNITQFIIDNDLNPRRVSLLLKWEKNNGRFIYFFNDSYSTVYYREVYGENRRGRINLITSQNGETLLHKPYILYTEGAILSEENDILVLAEGNFDIINTYFYIVPKIKATLISLSGLSNIKNVIMEYSKYHYRPRIFIVSDKDVMISWYRYYLLKNLDERISELSIFYNKLHKDVGEVRKGIDLEKITLKMFEPESEEIT